MNANDGKLYTALLLLILKISKNAPRYVRSGQLKLTRPVIRVTYRLLPMYINDGKTTVVVTEIELSEMLPLIQTNAGLYVAGSEVEE